MFLLYCRLAIVVACLVSAGVALGSLKKHKYPTYFKCALFGTIALLFSNIFYLALAVSGVNDSMFTVGVFGEVSSYLFIAVANAQYIPKEEEERKFHISILGVIASAMLLAIYALSIIFNQTLGNIVVIALYTLATIPCAYYGMQTASNRYKNPFRKDVAPFNILVTLVIVANALVHLAVSINQGSAMVIVGVASTVIASAAIIASVFVLKKGLKPWAM